MKSQPLICAVAQISDYKPLKVLPMYQLTQRLEQQSSSGIIVSTGLRSTGWLKSILTGATGIAGYLSGDPVKISEESGLSWNIETVLKYYLKSSDENEKKAVRILDRLMGEEVGSSFVDKKG